MNCQRVRGIYKYTLSMANGLIYLVYDFIPIESLVHVYVKAAGTKVREIGFS